MESYGTTSWIVRWMCERGKRKTSRKHFVCEESNERSHIP